jgi:lipid-A-disaccharide synthase
MKKIFIVTGEVSGDRIAAWYVNKLKQTTNDVSICAVGGNFLQAAGAKLYERFDTLNVVGLVEIARKLPFILRFMRQLCDHIIEQQFDEVIVVDFPGFNLRLIQKLKVKNPHLTITYLSPPQLWCWGAWRIKKLKKYTDRVIVLYPFEVAWYKQRGMTVEWLGSPVYELLAPYRSVAEHKKPLIALIPGSRTSEIEQQLPLFLQTASIIAHKYPEVQFVLPIAQSQTQQKLEAYVTKHNLDDIWKHVQCVSDEHEKFTLLSQCCAALSKPGTVSLELALLRVPTIIAFKTSWVTYGIGRPLVRVKYMSLPNLLMDKVVFKEIIQWNCRPDVLAAALDELYLGFKDQAEGYTLKLKELDAVAACLRSI